MGDKGEHIIHSLSHPMSQEKGSKIDCSGNDMDCDNPLSLVIYEDDTYLGVGDNSTLKR